MGGQYILNMGYMNNPKGHIQWSSCHFQFHYSTTKRAKSINRDKTSLLGIMYT